MNENKISENANNHSNDQEPQVERIAYEQPEIENEPNRKMMVTAIMGLCLVVLVMVGLSFLNKNKEVGETVKSQVQQIGTDVKSKNFELSQEQKTEQRNFNEFSGVPATQQQANAQEAQKADPLSLNPAMPHKPTFTPKVFKTSGSLAIATSSSQKNEIYTPDQNISWKEQARKFEEEKEYEGDTYTPKVATKDKFNPSLLLQKGTYIGCSLNTRLVSQIKGGISCTTSENIYSKDGVTLLIEKGSKIFGSFRSGEMNDGINRIFVVWSEIRTPNNINIPVQSGASDELGGSGMQGYVDHQWMKRFGASILLSMIDDVFNYAANGKRDNSYDYSENTRDATQQMANTALEEFIKIKPVLYRNQGDIVGVYVNRDIDFSKVYKLKVGKRK